MIVLITQQAMAMVVQLTHMRMVCLHSLEIGASATTLQYKVGPLLHILTAQ